MYTILSALGEITFRIDSVTPSLYAVGKCYLGEVRLKFKRFMSMDDRPQECGWVFLENLTTSDGEVYDINKPCAIY